MTSTVSASSEYSRTKVPASATVSGWRVALIKLGIVIALPAFILGAQLGHSLGLKMCTLSMLTGGVLLASMTALTGTVAVKSRLSAALITQFAFGRLGGRMVSAVLAATLLGWFGVTAQIFGESVQGIMTSLHYPVWSAQSYIIVGGALMVTTTVFGFSALQKLSDIAVPLLMIVLLLATYRSLHQTPLTHLMALGGTAPSMITGISAVVGGLATSVCVFPDLCRFARTPRHACLAAGLTFGLGLPMILIMSAVTSIATGQSDIIMILTTLGLGIPALLLLVFKAWATNSGNLYSASLSSATIFRGVAQPLIVAAGGAIGVLLAALGIISYFVPFLLILSIAIPPIAAIYVADFFLVRGQRYNIDLLALEPAISYPAFIAWISGITVGAASSHNLIALTGMPAADSILLSFGLYLLLRKYIFPRAAITPVAPESELSA